MNKLGTGFVHLHVHTEYSLPEAACRLEDLLQTAKSWGMEALAITDKGVVNGMIPFRKLAGKYGIHPIVGCEMAVDDAGSTLILLAATYRGCERIVELINGASFHPPISQGNIIALRGGRTGSIHRQIASGRMDQAERQALQYVKWFGKEHFFLEVQHHGFEDDDVRLERTVQLSREMKLPLVATHDVHYLAAEDAPLLHMIRHGKQQSETDSPPKTGLFYLPSPAEMKTKFRHLSDALANTVRSARRCRFQPESEAPNLPSFPLSPMRSAADLSGNRSERAKTDSANPPHSADDALRHLCLEGMRIRFGSSDSAHAGPEPENETARMNRELGL